MERMAMWVKFFLIGLSVSVASQSADAHIEMIDLEFVGEKAEGMIAQTIFRRVSVDENEHLHHLSDLFDFHDVIEAIVASELQKHPQFKNAEMLKQRLHVLFDWDQTSTNASHRFKEEAIGLQTDAEILFKILHQQKYNWGIFTSRLAGYPLGFDQEGFGFDEVERAVSQNVAKIVGKLNRVQLNEDVLPYGYKDPRSIRYQQDSHESVTYICAIDEAEQLLTPKIIFGGSKYESRKGPALRRYLEAVSPSNALHPNIVVFVDDNDPHTQSVIEEFKDDPTTIVYVFKISMSPSLEMRQDLFETKALPELQDAIVEGCVTTLGSGGF